MDELRRTTITAARADLETLEAEARHRHVSLTAVVAEAIAVKAQSLRAGHRPRFGVARSVDGRSAAEVAAEPVAHEPG